MAVEAQPEQEQTTPTMENTRPSFTTQIPETGINLGLEYKIEELIYLHNLRSEEAHSLPCKDPCDGGPS